MSKSIKKALCLTLAVAMTGSLFTACGKKEESKSKAPATLGELTSDTITLTYQFWEDGPIVDSLNEEWAKEHPNITIVPNEVLVTENNGNLTNFLGTDDMPDVFWVLGTPDFAITNGMLTNMAGMWDADPDAKNVIGGINEFKLGYLGTDGKWTTPVKFFPTEAWLNMNYFKTHNADMPATDWTFEDMEKCVENLTTGDNGWGVSEAVTVITWYPIASDPDCIGEFGWNGTEFDLSNWAIGMETEKDWIDNGWKAPAVIEGTEDQYPQDLGLVAMRLDNWWCWERYWDKDEMYTRHVYWVPYVLPHTEDNADSDVYLATMDFGGIYSECAYPREAYEVLKYFCWGADGWKYKLSKYDEIVAVGKEGDGASVSGLVPGPINNCPITTDDTIWDEYQKKHPTTLAGGDTVGKETYGVDRAPYFDAFFEIVKTSRWTCYGSAQIPGFDTWLANNYNSATLYDGFTGVEQWVLEGGGEPADKVKDLTESANTTNQEYLDQIKSILE